MKTPAHEAGVFYTRIDMPTIQIDGKEYDIDRLSDDAKVHIASIQYVDSEIARITALLAALQTARIGYSNAVKDLLPNADAQSPATH